MIIVSLAIVLAVSLLYWSILINMIRHWNVSSYSNKPYETKPLVSVVVCLHNEEIHIERLMHALKAQIYSNIEFIFVDDASKDHTRELIERHALGTIIPLSDHVGKKQALRIGIEQTKGTFIFCTDADCTMGKAWIESIVSLFQQTKADMIIAPVSLAYHSFFTKMQAIEFLSLSAVTASTALMNHPILCNGANLAFSKAIWNQNSIDLKMNYVSGDDMFLLEYIKKMNGKIVYAPFQEALVTTDSQKTLGKFIRQRTRWASKSSGYSDREIIFSTWLIVFFTLFPIILLMIGIIYDPIFLKMAILAWILKIMGDFFFLRHFRSFFSVWFSWYEFLLVAIVYPFYVLTVMLLSMSRSRIKWN